VLGATLSALLGCVSCQDGYPIPASQCDQWCDATKLFGCQPYDPAGCVVSCNKSGGDAPECHAQLDAVLGCLGEHPLGGLSCDDWFASSSTGAAPPPCFAEEQDFEACVVKFGCGYFLLCGG
jgi:hypothetical protein